MGSIKMRKQKREEENIGLRIQEMSMLWQKNGCFPVGYLCKKVELAHYLIHKVVLEGALHLAESFG